MNSSVIEVFHLSKLIGKEEHQATSCVSEMVDVPFLIIVLTLPEGIEVAEESTVNTSVFDTFLPIPGLVFLRALCEDLCYLLKSFGGEELHSDFLGVEFEPLFG